MCLPKWNGADTVYARLMTAAESINKRAYAAQRAADRRKAFRFSPDPAAEQITEALGIGDEETLKAMVHHYRADITW